MARQWMTPDGVVISETGSRQWMTPDGVVISENQPVAVTDEPIAQAKATARFVFSRVFGRVN